MGLKSVYAPDLLLNKRISAFKLILVSERQLIANLHFNRPFPSCFDPDCESKAKCKVFFS